MINQATLLAKYDDKAADYYLVDVRTPNEFFGRHIPGSINIPIETLEKRFIELPSDKHIITICEHGVRSGICQDFLKNKGFQADSLEKGLAVWTGQVEKSN